MGQRHVCTFRHAQRAAYRTAISAAQILDIITLLTLRNRAMQPGIEALAYACELRLRRIRKLVVPDCL